ncbi:hypothetical protein [Hymenobacter cavernae]|uniref:Uncharacterized protein n=1 Tax=Hymenobacter cavernae TaxID=2044852 RepID=A0ABQ1TPE4_9BACT|nr:hypothetical protein [Hymenobacter cavernae]GGE99808.1 hypothetical protein GCM10011383_08340 [Hymenobacter cavernae]
MQLKPEPMRQSHVSVRGLNIIDAIVGGNEQMNAAGNNGSGEKGGGLPRFDGAIVKIYKLYFINKS